MGDAADDEIIAEELATDFGLKTDDRFAARAPAPMDATSKISGVLMKANIEFAAFSTDGVTLFGDAESIRRAAEAFHSHSTIDAFRTLIRHQREEIGKLHAKLAALTPDQH